jgi:hypothetical protein
MSIDAGHPARVADRWPGPGGVVEDALVALADLVCAAAEQLEHVDPRAARDLRVRATKHTVTGIEGLLQLTS